MNRLLAIITLALIWAGSPSSSHALAKTIGGSACQISDENNLILGRGTTDLGSSGPAYTAVCSLIRDNTTNTTGLSALQVRVEKGDTTSRTCTARAHDAYGNLLKSIAKSVSGSGVKTFDWTNTLNVSSSTAYYTVRCSLGGSDFIKSLYWNEPTPGFGADAKIMPGNLCKSNLYAPLIRGTTRVTAGSSPVNGTYVQCGPLRDTFSLFSTLSALKVRGYNSAALALNCQGVIGDSYDGYLLAVTRDTNTVGDVTLDFGNSLNGWAFGAQYGLECWLNSNADAIYSVAWTE